MTCNEDRKTQAGVSLSESTVNVSLVYNKEQTTDYSHTVCTQKYWDSWTKVTCTSGAVLH